MKKIMLMLAALTLLVSCGSPSASEPPQALPSAELPGASPSDLQPSPEIPSDEPPSESPDVSPGEVSAEPSPVGNTSGIDHPFPTKGSNKYRRVWGQITAYNEGAFVVERDGIYADAYGKLYTVEEPVATNYQVWAEFADKIDKGMDAEITVQTFHDSRVLEEQYNPDFHRCDLSVTGGIAEWTDAEDSGNNASGELSLPYDPETGLHEILIDGQKVFEFTYFPPDPRQVAQFWGFTPLEELPADYSRGQAERDGCLVIYQDVIQNQEALIAAWETDEQTFENYGYFIRIFEENADGITITDYGIYNTRICQQTDCSRLNAPPEERYVTTIHDSASMSMEDGRGINGLISFGIDSDMYGSFYIFKDLPYVE